MFPCSSLDHQQEGESESDLEGSGSSLEESDSDLEGGMDKNKKRRMLNISKKFVEDVEDMLQDSPELPSKPGTAVQLLAVVG